MTFEEAEKFKFNPFDLTKVNYFLNHRCSSISITNHFSFPYILLPHLRPSHTHRGICILRDLLFKWSFSRNKNLWPGLSVGRWLVGRLVGRSICPNFLKGQKVTFPCTYSNFIPLVNKRYLKPIFLFSWSIHIYQKLACWEEVLNAKKNFNMINIDGLTALACLLRSIFASNSIQ